MTDTDRLIQDLRHEVHAVHTDRRGVEQTAAEGNMQLAQYGTWRLDRLEELLTKAAAEIKRLQAENAAIDEVLGAAVEEYGREAAEVVLTRTEDGSVQIETRCKPEADEFATGETVSNAASNMVGRWCE